MSSLPTARRSAWQIWCAQYATLIAMLAFTPSVGATQSASFAGTVLADSTERPIADAQVSLPDIKRSVRSDSSGNFLITGLKAGRYLVQIRRVGYVAIDTWFNFKDAQKLEADLLMQPLTVQLSTVLVRDATTRRTTVREQEFEEHRNGFGRVFARELLEKEYGRPLMHILRARTPGIASRRLGSSGEALENSRSQCLVQIVVNGIIMYRPGLPVYDMNQINSLDVLGMIYYTYPETPARYGGRNGACGTLLIWTNG